MPIQLAGNKGISPHQIREIERLVFRHYKVLKEKYYEFHKSEKTNNY